MKKKRLAGLLLLAPLSLLAACGGGGPTSLPLSANWYEDTSHTSIEGTNEVLVYDVTFTPPTERGEYYVEYDVGTYTTTLTSSPYRFDDGNSANVYHYHTELQISGHYVYGDTEGETFHDRVTSDVYFHGMSGQDNNLRPIESHKEIISTNPVSSPSKDKLNETLSLTYDAKYSTAAAVNAPLESVTVTLTNLGTDVTKGPTEIEIDTDSSYFDNEQILFALRALKMDQAVSFETNNMQTDEIATVKIPEAPAAEPYSAPFNINGVARETESIDAYKVQFSYYNGNKQLGRARTAYYAKTTDMSSNTYRNVLLRLEDPIADGYGTLQYTLKDAKFTK